MYTHVRCDHEPRLSGDASHVPLENFVCVCSTSVLRGATILSQLKFSIVARVASEAVATQKKPSRCSEHEGLDDRLSPLRSHLMLTTCVFRPNSAASCGCWSPSPGTLALSGSRSASSRSPGPPGTAPSVAVCVVNKQRESGCVRVSAHAQAAM